MKKVLLLPFLRFHSGHHQVADALREYIRIAEPDAQCEKIDIFSYASETIEALVSRIYLRWIHSFPGVYSWIYRKSAYSHGTRQKRFYSYELLFLEAMRALLREQQPDLVLCTHCLPSYIVGRLRRLGETSVPFVNVYTDFFINNVWDRRTADYHFVPDRHIKEQLTASGVEDHRIFVTGIPVHPEIDGSPRIAERQEPRVTVLLAGGSLGAGQMRTLIENTRSSAAITYKVLCGKNRRLFDELRQRADPHIVPMPYIESKSEINRLYHEADAILTKPGGVTMSECIRIGLPPLIYHSLPGQEEINFRYLFRLGLVHDWHDWHVGDMESRLLELVSNRSNGWKSKLETYRRQLTEQDLVSTVRHILRSP
ncbi:MGDG synthase family glycosyltransferase [Paenibacillus sp.]|uniref:MGDG synthase family glycosyltransferase n=1 Tax=Paenibacillus sp. TaxID=58172 RepID=UPI002D45CFC0|nr:UDP-glucuronosyltransferase [Paenibacillus sp.]HZG84740.1 UDP-glucuronosyltransferase [Paenibacillus sp.]